MNVTDKTKQRLREAHRRRYSDPEYRERLLRKNAEWQSNNKAKRVAHSLKWKSKNLERARETQKRWRQSPEGKAWRKAWDAKHRAEKLAVTVNPKSINVFISAVRTKRQIRCYYCQEFVSGKIAHIDHIIPLSKGGAHSVENLCATCPHCNHTKSAKLLKDFIVLGQQLLEL